MHSRLAISALGFLLSAPLFANDWMNWRGPLQNGASLEHYTGAGKLTETPAWTYPARGRGTPVICDGKVILWGYKGETTDLIELLTCIDAKTGAKIWEHELPDYLSDTIYNRYSIGAPTIDPDTKRIYLVSNAGTFYCFEFDGKKVFEIPLMENFGRMTFPNSRVGSPVIDGDIVMVHYIFSNWGADGPGADRIYGFDKKTGELVWWARPGIVPPVDSSYSTPVLETRDGKRVLYYATGCGHVVCLNARSGKPYWKFPFCKNGVNSSVVLHNGNLIAIHNDENLDTTEKGRMICIKLPEKLQAPIPPETESTILEPGVEVWRLPLAATSSSPVLAGDTLYQITDGAELYAINAVTGAQLWKMKLSNANLHSSPLYVDGLLYCPMLEGKLIIIKPGEKAGEVVQEIKLEGSCLGAPSVCDGVLYVTTTEKLYAFPIPNGGIKTDAAPVAEVPKAGKAVALQVIPAEVSIMAGDKQSFRIRSVDANGLVVSEDVKGVKWQPFIPPTAKVKATMNAHFNEAGELAVAADAKPSAGAFKATSPDGLTGTIRGRTLKNLPITEDFEEFELTDEFPADPQGNPPYKFAYPPLPWIGARLKFQVMEKDGSKVFGKSFDRLLFQRASVFIAPPHLKNYTMQADVLTEGNARSKSDVGFIHQRYLVCLRGNAGKLEVSSNPERLKQEVPFKLIANKWYTLKSRVETAADGGGVISAKVWEKGTPEPGAWTIEVKPPRVHQHGSPGLFGFTPLNQRRMYIDNLSVTPNQ